MIEAPLKGPVLEVRVVVARSDCEGDAVEKLGLSVLAADVFDQSREGVVARSPRTRIGVLGSRINFERLRETYQKAIIIRND